MAQAIPKLSNSRFGVMKLNRRAMAALNRLAQRYESERPVPDLREVENALWRASEFAARPCRGYWPWTRGWGRASLNLEPWTSKHIGWSFPCAEAVALIRRPSQPVEGRVIDVGAGLGLWTRVLKRALRDREVIGLDPESKCEGILKATFKEWCDDTGGFREGDRPLLSWLPCGSQPGASLGTEVLEAIQPGQQLIYIGSGPKGPAGTVEFHDQLSMEFLEHATEPLPRVHQSVFPRDFIRIYQRKD